MRLQNQVAIVTGASRGIGASIAEALAAEGCDVVLAARTASAIEARAGELAERYGVQTLAIPADVAQEAEVWRLVAEAAAHFGRVDILVNNAGMGLYGAVDEIDLADLRHVFDVNFYSAIAGMQAVAPIMRQQGGGTIVNVSSVVGRFASPLGGGYTATKHAMHGASAAARAELARDGIKVVLLCPGLTETEFSQHSTVSVPGAVRRSGESLAPMSGISPERVGQRAVQAILRGEVEAYVTWYDRAMVLASQLLPGPFSRGLELFAWIRRQRFARLQPAQAPAEEPSRESAPDSGERDVVIALTPAQLLGVLAAGALAVGFYLRGRRG